MLNWVPPTTSKTIVFPWNKAYKAFYTEFYEPEMTNDKVSLQEINQFLYEVSVEYNLSTKSMQHEDMKQVCFVMLLMIILFVDLFLFLFPPRDDFFGLFTNGEMIILLTWFLLVFMQLFGCIRCSKRFDFQSQHKDRCQDIVDKHNEILRSRELKWHLPDQFPTWIELTKDMKKQNNSLEIPYLIPLLPETTIIFPRQRYKSYELPETWRFSLDFFSPDMAGDRISGKEVQELLSEINSYLRMANIDIPKKILLFILFPSLPLFGLRYVSNHYPDLFTTFQTIIIAVISVSVSLYLWFLQGQREEKKLYNYMWIGSQEIINKHNETLQTRGLKWKLPKQFPFWIELCKNPGESIQLLDIPPNKRSDPLIAGPQDDSEAQKQNDVKKLKNDMYAPLLEDEN